MMDPPPYPPGTPAFPNVMTIRVEHSPGMVIHDDTGTINATAPCPDMLSIRDIGAADNLRGRVVRAFFRAISWWSPGW